ncbi:sigma-54-dependent transcriptional regulator [Novispirillum sp. DQ9]|uniref:sigma-54-dependent transcriptional regulator n=1 Tax=Novispirillum sp. DQ9 TaxID=3398612 RepID=UPI003C7B4329
MTVHAGPVASDQPMVLVVEDDDLMRLSLEDRLNIEGIPAMSVASIAAARQLLASGAADVVVSDIRLPDGSGIDLFGEVIQRAPRMPVILMTAFGSVQEAVGAVKQGAMDYLIKPFAMDAFVAQIRRALEQVRAERRAARLVDAQGKEFLAGSGVLGRSPAMRRIEQLVHRLGEVDSSVLITGESGVGKEVVANLIHLNSTRAKGPFIKVNCAALPATLVEAELFGHEKGAFTGAHRQRIGRIEQAQGGTLLLDEIAEVPPETQVKLLRVLQERSLERLGGEQTIALDVRILAATQVDLPQAMQDGRFRQDLFWRLNVIQIAVPPLRERPEDVTYLARQFIAEVSRAQQKAVAGMDHAAEGLLLAHAFPGNVRELKNIIERAVVLCDGPVIREKDLRGGEAMPSGLAEGDEGTVPLKEAVEQTEKKLIQQALQRHQWHMSETAAALGISRKNLWEKMRRYDISR